MATNSNKKNFKRVLNGVWNAICWCGNALVKMLEVIAIMFVLALLTVFFYNPIIFVPLAFIRPRTAAKSLYDWDLDAFTDFWQFFYTPLEALLPFSCKKYFMAINGIHKYSPKLQVKYVTYRHRESEQMIKLVKKMTDEAVALFWVRSEWQRQCVIRAGKVLTDSQFYKLTVEGEFNLAQEYVEKHTPSETMMKALLDARFGNTFCYCVERYGLSSAMVNYFYQYVEQKKADKEDQSMQEYCKAILAAVEEALQHYADRQMVRNTQNSNGCEMWIDYLKDGNRPCVSAQKMMTPWQYGEYHSAGLVLASSAVEYFLSRADQSMCVRIFEYEDKEKFTDKAKSLIKANPTLMQWWLDRRRG